MSKFTTIEERFWAKVNKTDTCWLWTASVWDNGYGRFVKVHGTDTPAHRFSWALHNGAIPDGLWVLHKCDVRRCVRPDHLFLGTPQDNMDDKCRKGRHRCGVGSMQPRAKLNEVKVLEIKAMKGLATATSVGLKYGVSYSIITGIWNGTKWKHVKDPAEKLHL
jgi:hypothetical protein